MRGKDRKTIFERVKYRITPAYAGKSFWGTVGYKPIRDHPRLCGEKFCLEVCKHEEVGSPPPMRGKANDRSFCIVGTGITPAYAGKRIRKRRAFKVCWDHPRLCGEKYATGLKFQSILGSPPPMRGKVSDDLRRNVRIGITPAYAGKSMMQGDGRNQSLGSPPPMRGKAQFGNNIYASDGITPAYAGKRISL